ncbi:MAG: LCP family protein [Chloroflexota bacterium]|nr:MAG: LCP family protein [Chloroflexota bacterium]
MRIKLPFILTAITSLISACNFPMAPIAAPAAVSMNPDFLFVPVNATATATPFQPLPPTATYLPSPTPAPPTPEPTQEIGSFTANQDSNSTPVGLLPQPKGQVNILLLGSDQRFGTGGFRTDTILLITINPADNSINITSFPRDLYVTIPGYTTNRINTALARGGFETIADTFAYNFGVRPDYYVLINFWSFVELVDSLGGVDVYASQPLSEYTSVGWVTIPAGVNHMDGTLALYYSRSRMSTSDFDRNRRQQEVIVAIVDKLINLYTIAKIPELYRIYAENVTTNINMNNIIPLIPIAARIRKTKNIENYYIGRGQVTSWVTPGGAQVLLPNQAAVMSVMRAALNSP